MTRPPPDDATVHAAQSLARAMVDRHLGGEPTTVAREPGGQTNVVFACAHPRGDVVVRVSPHADRLDVFRRERWATDLARAADVPTPEVVAVGEDRYPYMIARRAVGAPATHHPKRLAVLRALGACAARINAIATRGFGSVYDHVAEAVVGHAAWRAYLRDELLVDQRLAVLERHRLLDPARAARLRAIVEGVPESAVPRLNHGDLRLKNVLVDDAGAITALIDWEDAGSNLPAWDLSIALHDLTIDQKQEFLAGYGLDGGALDAAAPLIKALNVLNYAHDVERVAAAGDAPALAWHRTRLGGALDLYSF